MHQPDYQPVKTILLIDDEIIIRSSTGAMLTDLGYRVLLAEDGRQGIELFRNHSEEIGLVMMDINMPEMDGFEVFDRIRDIHNKAKIVVTSGCLVEDNYDAFMERGAVAVIKKPYRRKILIGLLSKNL